MLFFWTCYFYLSKKPEKNQFSSFQNNNNQCFLAPNEWCIYIALYCVLLYTQRDLQSNGGSLLNHHQCAASTWMMWRLPQDNGASVLTTHQLQVERRHRAKQVDGGYCEAMIDKDQWWEFGQNTGVTPLREVPWDF